MSSTTAAGVRDVRYEPEEQPPPALAIGLGFQFAMLTVAGIVLTPAIVVRAAGTGEDFLSWAVFAALAISGITTVLQAVRVGRIGSGHVLLMGTSAAFIAVCVTSLIEGGPGLLATLVTVSALFQFGLSTQLSLLRRILTPTVCGTVIMLIPVTLMPIMFGMLTDVPEGSPAAAAPMCAIVTLVVTVGVTLRATGVWRLWAPVIGIVTGCAVAGAYGLYDTQLVAEAGWIGLPSGAWPGFDLTFGVAFWSLLPAFVFVTLIGAIETIGDGVAIQRVSRRRPRAIDYRVVQGAVTADGVGNLLSGLAATVPNTTYSSSVSVTEITGVASRTVGIYIGAVFIVLAFLPKFMALILAIPGPVVGAYTIVLMATLFVLGMRVVVEDGVDYRKGVVAGVGFWIGLGLQNELIFAEALGAWSGLLGNGMTAGGLAAILMTLFLEFSRPRPHRLRTALNADAYPTIDTFLTEFADTRGWSEAMTDRLRAVGEETLLTLIRQDEKSEERRLQISARNDGRAAELEFVAATDETNIEDRMAVLGDRVAGHQAEQEVSLRLLRHLASSVRHQQYHETDVVTVRVEASA
jgi:NCS2 family nucleobase:cation symporter-2/xanthine permease XanP